MYMIIWFYVGVSLDLCGVLIGKRLDIQVSFFLISGNTMSKACDNCAVKTFCFSVILRILCWRGNLFTTWVPTYICEEIVYKLCAMVR